MNTFAKIGRVALMHFFSRREIFEPSRYEYLGITKVLPRLLSASKEPIDLEKEYLSHSAGTLGRENDYRIYVYEIQLGLPEIELIYGENEGNLIDLIYKAFFAKIPSHIVIAEKKMWQGETSCGNDDSYYSQEEVTIYSLTEEQKQAIEVYIDEKMDDGMFETEEEFTFNHLEFPCKSSEFPFGCK